MVNLGQPGTILEEVKATENAIIKYQRDLMISMSLITVLAAAKYIRKIRGGNSDNMGILCKTYHLFEKAPAAAIPYNE